MAGLIDSFCLESLPKTSLDFLLGLSDEYKIVVAIEKRGDKAYVLKLVLTEIPDFRCDRKFS